MHIAFAGLAPGADPLRVGGQQSILRRLAHALRDRGHEVDFYVLDPAAAQPSDEAWHIRHFPHLSPLLADLRHQDYDYVQFSRVPLRWYPALIAGLRQVTARRGYLYLVHLPNPFLRRARQLLFRLAFDQVFVVSPRLRAELAGLGKPVHLLWPPVPAEFFQAGVQREPATSEVRLTYLGRIAADKGVAEVAAAFECLCGRYGHVRAEVHGYLAGSSAADTRLHQTLLAQPSPAVRYVVAGAMDAALRPNEDAALEILRRSDVVVLPYLSLDRLTIDVPLLLLEAMATGCVVVSTPVGDIPAILDDPMLVGRPGELYARLDQLISPRGPLCRAGDLRARGARLRQRALDLGVNVESVADTFLERLSGPINP